MSTVDLKPNLESITVDDDDRSPPTHTVVPGDTEHLDPVIDAGGEPVIPLPPGDTGPWINAKHPDGPDPWPTDPGDINIGPKNSPDPPGPEGPGDNTAKPKDPPEPNPPIGSDDNTIAPNPITLVGDPIYGSGGVDPFLILF